MPAADAVIAAMPAAPVKALGTAVAAERTAAKLAALARAMSAGLAAKDLAMPEGWFLYLTALVKRSATAMPDLAADEAGAGLFDSPQRALDLLLERLRDPETLAREAGIMALEARSRVDRSATAASGGILRRSLRAAWGWTLSPIAPAAAKLTDRFTVVKR